MSYTSYRPPCKKTKRAETYALSKEGQTTYRYGNSSEPKLIGHNTIFDKFCKDVYIFRNAILWRSEKIQFPNRFSSIFSILFSLGQAVMSFYPLSLAVASQLPLITLKGEPLLVEKTLCLEH